MLTSFLGEKNTVFKGFARARLLLNEFVSAVIPIKNERTAAYNIYYYDYNISFFIIINLYKNQFFRKLVGCQISQIRLDNEKSRVYIHTPIGI